MQEIESAIITPACLEGGGLRVTASPRGVRRIELFEDVSEAVGRRTRSSANSSTGILEEVSAELDGYFSGEKISFRAPLDLDGSGTPFQRRVWDALFEIHRGELLTYGELAAMVGSPRAARAVGQAVGKNPLPIIFPCHRVVSSDGRLGGFSCGVSLKVLLLEIEGIVLKEADRRPCPGTRWSSLRMGRDRA